MKKLLFISALLVASLAGYSQVPIGCPTCTTEIKGILKIDSLFLLPFRNDTLINPGRGGALVFAYGKTWLYTGVSWSLLTGAVWGSIPGNITTQTDLMNLFNVKQNQMSSGYGWKLNAAVGAFDSAVVRKVDTIYKVDSATIGFAINGHAYSIAISGSASGGTIASLSLAVPTSLFTSPVAFSNTAGNWTGTMSLANQGTNNFFAGPVSGSPATPAWRRIAVNDLPTGIPNGNLATPTINLLLGTAGTLPSWAAPTVTLGGTATINIPGVGPSSTGTVTPTLFSFWNAKLDSTVQSNDSIYEWRNGIRFFRYVVTGGGGSGFNQLTGDVIAGPGTGSQAATVVALQNKPITLATGYFKYNGSSFLFDNSTFLTSISGITAGGDLAGTYPNPTIGTNAITNAKAAQMPTNTLKGNNTGGTANAADLTVTQVNTMLGLGTAAFLNVAASGDASSTQVVKGNDSRLSFSALMAANTLKGNNTGSTAAATDLTVTQVRTLLGLGTAALVNVPSSGNAISTQAVLGSDTRLAPSITFTPAPSYVLLSTSSGTGDTLRLATNINAGAMSPQRVAQLDSMHNFSDSLRIFRKIGSDSIFLCSTPFTSGIEVCAFQYLDSAGSGSGSGGITQLTGDGTTGPGTGSQIFTLATVNPNPGTWGDATHVAVPTVNSKGLVTGMTNVAIAASVSNLGFTSDAFSGSVSSSNGTSAPIPGGTEGAAGLITAAQVKRVDSTTIFANVRGIAGTDSLFYSKLSLGTGLPDSAYARGIGLFARNGILVTDSSVQGAILKLFRIDTSAKVTNPLTQGMATATYATLAQFSTMLVNPMTSVGDIIQGGISGTAQRLASVATGNVLLSGGVTTANSWGKVGLTTHVSGILPVANGGTGAAAGTGYAFGNGTSPYTFSSTIPGASVSGNIAGNAANITGQLSITSFNNGTGAASNSVWFGDGTWKTFTSGGTVTSVSVANLSPLFTVAGATLTTTPAFTFSLSNSAAHTFFGNFTGSVGAASYSNPSLTSDFINQGTIHSLLHGNAAGNPSWGAVDLTTEVTGLLPLANGGTAANLSATGGSHSFLKQALTGAAITVTAVTDADLSISDITTNNVSTSAHGLVPKAPNDATKYLDGTGAYSRPGAIIVAQNYLQQQGVGATLISYSASIDRTIRISGYMNVLAIGGGEVVVLRASWTDENSVSRTSDIATTGIGSTGYIQSSNLLIRVHSGTTVTIVTVATTGGGTITFDQGGLIELIN